MRNTVLLGLLVAGAAGIGLAVADDTPLPIEPPGARPGLPNPPVTRTCEDIEAEARALVEDAARCDVNMTGGCEVVSLETLVAPDSCVAAFQCAVALSPDVDQEAFADAARRLEEEKILCGECAEAACRPPGELDAECVSGTCELVPRMGQPGRPMPPRP